MSKVPISYIWCPDSDGIKRKMAVKPAPRVLKVIRLFRVGERIVSYFSGFLVPFYVLDSCVLSEGNKGI